MTYEYVCQACGHQWEAEQSIKDNPLKKCEACGEDKAKRLVSGGTGFLLKGGGWYADLYGSPGSGAAKSGGSDDKGSKASASNAAPGSSESKPAAGESKPAADAKPSTSAASTPAAASSSTAGSAKAS